MDAVDVEGFEQSLEVGALESQGFGRGGMIPLGVRQSPAEGFDTTDLQEAKALLWNLLTQYILNRNLF